MFFCTPSGCLFATDAVFMCAPGLLQLQPRTSAGKTIADNVVACELLDGNRLLTNSLGHAPAEAGLHAELQASRIPRSLECIDNGKILGFGAGLAEDHPVRPHNHIMLTLSA
jgi:hypothetical protein